MIIILFLLCYSLVNFLQILNVDDLRSLTPSEPSTTEQASHISVAIPPPPQSKPTPTVNTTQITQNTAGRDHHKPLQHSRMRHSSSSSIHSSRIGAELKTKVASTPAKPKKSSSDLHGGREGRQKSFRWSDLDTDSEFYGHPGHAGNGGYQNNIHVLSSSAETTDFNRTGDSGDDRGGNSRISKKRRKFEKKVKARSSSGLFTHTQQFGKHGGIQLLHLEPFDRERGHTARRDEGQLEHEFPGLAKALKQFNDSVAPSFQQFASAGSKTQPAATGYKSMPLLQLPHMPDEAPPVAPPSFHVPKQAPPIAPPTMQPPPHVQQARYQSSAVGGKVPMPLLIIPNQPQTLSIPHPVSAGGGSNHNIPPPPADSANLPTAVSHLTTSQASYLTYVPGPMRSSVGPHTTAVKPSLLHNPHTFSSPHPAPSGAQHSSIDFKLPQVPVRPFVPILLPPPPPPPSQILNHGRQADTSCDPTSASVRPMGPQLLQLNDPLSRMKREGFKLLKDDPRDGEERVLPELRLLHLERGPPPPPSSIEEQEELKKILPTAKTEQTREQPQMTADVKQSGLKQVDSSGGSLTTISSTTEESSEMPPPSESRGDRGGERQGRTGRRQRGRRGKGVAWKMDQEESEKPQESSANATSSEIDGDTYTLSNKDETVCPWTLPAHSGSDHTEGKSEKKPLIGQSSGKNRSFPDEIPLQRLELRRLDMNASFIPTSPQLHVSPSSPGQESIHHVGATETTDNRLNDRPLSSSLAKTCPPKTSEIGIQVDPMPVKATPEGGEERETLTNSCSTSEQPSVIEPAAKMTISSAVQVSPEHFSETGGEKRTKASEQSAAIDSIEVTSVSSLDSEEVRVQLSDSDDDENDGGLPSTEQQDEFMPPPLWHNSHSPIPIPAKTKGTDSPIPEAKEAPPVSSSLFAGFSATPPPPLPMPLSMESANDQEHLNPKSHSQSPVPEISHQQPRLAIPS